MLEFLSSAWFRYVIFPVGGAALGIYVKYVSRNDQYAKFRKEDLAIGLELLLTACLMFVASTTDRAIELVATNRQVAEALDAGETTQATSLQQAALGLSQHMASAGWVIAVMFLGLWGLSNVVRKMGWAGDDELHPGLGIALPLVLGILALVAVMAGVSP